MNDNERKIYKSNDFDARKQSSDNYIGEQLISQFLRVREYIAAAASFWGIFFSYREYNTCKQLHNDAIKSERMGKLRGERQGMVAGRK